MKCELLHQKGEPDIRWEKDGKPIKKKKKDTRIKADWNVEDDLYFLEIQEATAADAGEYTVVAESEAGSVTSKVTVTVDEVKLEKAKVEKPVQHADEAKVEEVATEETAPVFEVEPESARVSEGQTIKLTCKVSGILNVLLMLPLQML